MTWKLEVSGRDWYTACIIMNIVFVLCDLLNISFDFGGTYYDHHP